MGVYGDYTNVLNEQYTVLPFGIIIGVGVLFFFSAVLGWCAASRNSRACFGVVRIRFILAVNRCSILYLLLRTRTFANFC